MLSLSSLLTTLGVMSNQDHNFAPPAPSVINNNNIINPNNTNNGGLASIGNNLHPSAEGSMERGSCLLRYASQNSLDESSQKHIQRPPTNKDRTVGQYQNELHTSRSFAAMNEMRKLNRLCDVVLVAENVEIPAHKMVLASCSPYFYAMFTNFEESRQTRVTLQGVDHNALELLIGYVYTSMVEVNEDNVQVLLTAANLLQLTDVRDACCDYLQTQLDSTNCLGIRDFADIHGCLELVSYADTYIEQHFNEVIQFDEFFNMTHLQVINLIKNDRISVGAEEKVYECVINWIRYDPTTRKQYTGELMEHVRLPFLSKEYLTQRVDKEPLMEGNIICKNLIIEALTYHLLPNDIQSARTVPRRPVGTPKILLVCGGQAPKAIRSVECYDLREERWYQAAEMPNRRCRAGLAVLGDKVYAVGGFNGSLRVRTVDVYDPATDQWSTSSSMEARRSTLGVAVLNGRIYAVGGFDGTSGLSTAEIYTPKRDIWHFIAPMVTKRSSVGVGVVNGFVYAVGGYDGCTRQCLSSVERYNPETNTWYPVTDMSSRRSGAGVGVLNNMLYAVGGHDGPSVRRSVEAYNPETNQWYPVACMSFRRRNAGVVAHDGLLYVVGGDDGDANLTTVEVYSPETNTWHTLAAPMSIGRSYAGVCIVDKPIQTANITALSNVDDESNQAEGSIEGAIGFVRNEQNINRNSNNNNNNINNTNSNNSANSNISNNNNNIGNANQIQNHPHYENIYETIEQYNVAANGGALINTLSANVPAEGYQAQQQPSHRDDGNTLYQPQLPQQCQRLLGKANYRNEPCDRFNIGSNVNLNAGNRENNYDIPKSVKSGLGFRRNFQMDLHAVNPRFNALRCNGIGCGHANSHCQRPTIFDDAESQHYYNLYNYRTSSAIRFENVYEQIRDEPIYRNVNGNGMFGRLNVIGHGIGRIERHLSSSCGNIDHCNLGGHYAVLGHSHFGTMGHIRLNNNNLPAISNGCIQSTKSNTHNSSNTSSSTNSASMKEKEANNVKISSSSFFSCLHGESTQSMSNIYKAATQAETTEVNTSSVNNDSTVLGASATCKERESRILTAAPVVNTATIINNNSTLANANAEISRTSTNGCSKPTGAIPKMRSLNLGSTTKSSNSNIPVAEKSYGTTLKSGLNRKTSNSTPVAWNVIKATTSVSSNTTNTICNTVAEAQQDSSNNSNNSLNRNSKSSLQWLLVNKWLPLWMGQGTECKVIDFNFMFSRDCIDCDTITATDQFANPYATAHLSTLPQDIVRFNATAAMCCPSPISTIDTLYRQPVVDVNNRPLRSTFQRFHESHSLSSSQQYFEDPSYENVYVHWRNGFEFARSREADHQQRSAVQRAHSESPMLQQKIYNNHTAANTQIRRLRNQNGFPNHDFTSCGQNKLNDPYRNYELNIENNSFKPKPSKTDSIETSTNDININNKTNIIANHGNSGNITSTSETLTAVQSSQIQADISLIPLNPIESNKAETAAANVIIINNSNHNDVPNDAVIISNSSGEGSSSSSSSIINNNLDNGISNNETFKSPDNGNNTKAPFSKDQSET